MTTVLLLLAIFSLLHFAYESIIAPSIRLRLRFELFKLRDDVRELKITYGKELQEKHFGYLQDSINSLIANQSRLDVATAVFATHEMEKDPELKARIVARSKILDDCPRPEAKEIRRKTVRIVGKSMLVNSGGLMIYVVPIVGLIVCYKEAKAARKSIASMSEGEFERVSPVPRKAALAGS